MKRSEQAALEVYPQQFGKAEMPNGVTIEFEGREVEREIFIEGYERAIKDAVELLKNGGTAPAVELPRWKKAEINDKGWRFYAGRCLYHDGYTLSLDALLSLPKDE